jgi:hypothetical protein
MKKKLILTVFALCMVLLCACGANTDSDILYTPDATTEQADRLFESKSENELIALSMTMAGNNDFKEEQNNYFNYLLAKITDIDTNNDSDKYTMCLNIIKKCLKEPLTQANVIAGFKQLYYNIDTKLSQETMEYMKGEWLRIDKTSNSGMKVRVDYDEELGLCARISALPEGATNAFRIGDVKWNSIEFANYGKFYLNDLVIEELTGKTYYKNDSKTTSILKGSTATIDTEKGTIRIKYDSASGVTSGANQLWAKIGSESEIAYKEGNFREPVEEADEEDGQENDDTADDNAKDKNHESIMSENSITNSNVEDTTKTASTEQTNTQE